MFKLPVHYGDTHKKYNMKYFVRSGALLGFPQLAREFDQNPSKMLREVGLATSVLHDPDLYLPYAAVAELLELAGRRCAIPDFGFRLGARQGLEVIGALGSVMSLQSDIPSALQMMQQNLDFHARGVQVSVDVNTDTIDMRLTLLFQDEVACAQLNGLSAALFYRCIRQLYQQELRPLKVELAIPKQLQTEQYAKLFGCQPNFGASSNLIRFPAQLLQLPISIPSEVRQWMDKRWRHDLIDTEPVSLGLQVERAITALLPTGECSLAIVAHVVGMHPRILQRKLKEKHTCFGTLLNNTRLRLASHYLKNSDIDLTSLALNLGYGDLAAFSRAFKKWTGSSPRQWRKAATE